MYLLSARVQTDSRGRDTIRLIDVCTICTYYVLYRPSVRTATRVPVGFSTVNLQQQQQQNSASGISTPRCNGRIGCTFSHPTQYTSFFLLFGCTERDQPALGRSLATTETRAGSPSSFVKYNTLSRTDRTTLSSLSIRVFGQRALAY